MSLQFGRSSSFLWRLMRAYSDVHDISATLEEKKAHAERGNPNPNLSLILTQASYQSSFI